MEKTMTDAHNATINQIILKLAIDYEENKHSQEEGKYPTTTQILKTASKFKAFVNAN
jgi:hypothetical protein